MNVQSINCTCNKPNFGARIKISKDIPQGILADGLTMTYVPVEFLSDICMSGKPFHNLTDKYVEKSDKMSLLNGIMRKIGNKIDNNFHS